MKRYYFAERIWIQTALLSLAAVPAVMFAYKIDPRLLNDLPIWTKPLKFFVSTTVQLATLAILARFLPEKTRSAIWLSVLAAASSVAAIMEIGLIAMQSGRGVASHFNFSTPFDIALYNLMGIGVIIFLLPAFVLGIRILRAQTTERLTLGLKWGAGLGLFVGGVLTLILGGYMSQQTGHWVDAAATDAGGVPIVGWSRNGGDLRVAHFISTHLMQVLPFIGFLADRIPGLGCGRQKWVVLGATMIGAGIAIATFLQALAGEPLIRG